MTLRSAVASVGRNPQGQRIPLYFDLQRGGVISRNQLRAAAGIMANGFDNPEFSIAVDRR